MNNALDNFSLPFLLDELVEAGLPKSIAERLNFLPSLILGTEGIDSLTGTEDRDYIFGLGGDDSIEGLGGNDFLFSGEGNNTVRGGDGRDRIYGKSGADRLFGDAGDDRFRDISGGNEIDGGEGRDTVNYRNVDEAIALEFKIRGDFLEEVTSDSGLQITQPNLEPDRIDNIERIIAPEGKANSIDFQDQFLDISLSGPSFAQSVSVNLAEETLETEVAFEEVSVTIENFVDVVGSSLGDIIIGDEADNNLDGRLGDNLIEGGEGNDFISTFERDTLTGGGGSDTFQIRGKTVAPGSFIGPFPPTTRDVQGSTITDFQPGEDSIQLSSTSSEVRIVAGFSSIYTGFSELPLGQLDPSLFRFAGSGDAPSSPHIAYDSSSGDLFYQEADLSSKIATLQGAPALSASDIFVV